MRLLVGRSADPRSAIAVAGLAAAVVGLLGADAGLLWLVAGVWTVRAFVGAPLGLGWGLAVIGAGMRWGTLALFDLEVATRVAGPTVATGPVAVRMGMIAALVAAMLSEASATAQGRGILASSWGERAAAGLALAALAPLFCVPGPETAVSAATLAWVTVSAVAVALVLLARSVGQRVIGLVPDWVPPALAVAGVVATVLGS